MSLILLNNIYILIHQESSSMKIQAIKTKDYKSNAIILQRRPISLPIQLLNSCTEFNNLPKCNCPEIMCCDDEIYQHFVIKKLIELEGGTPKASSITNSPPTNKTLKMTFCLSGEDLIKKYEEFKRCSCCQGPKMMISDYYMGLDQMRGVDVIMKLRELGYDGVTILRTSTSVRSISDDDFDIHSLLEDKKITYYIEKNNLKYQRDILRKCVLNLF